MCLQEVSRQGWGIMATKGCKGARNVVGADVVYQQGCVPGRHMHVWDLQVNIRCLCWFSLSLF